MTPAFRLLNFISAREGPEDRRKSVIKGLYVTATEDCPNDYADYKTISAGTIVQCDFGGDFGFYGFADDNGTLRRTRVSLQDVNKFDWSPHQAEIDALSPEAVQ